MTSPDNGASSGEPLCLFIWPPLSEEGALRRNGLQTPWSPQQQGAIAMILVDGVLFSWLLAPSARLVITLLFNLSYIAVVVSGFILLVKDPSRDNDGCQCINAYLKVEDKDEDKDEELGWCRFCEADAKGSTKHCFECNKCVPYFDHHCPWLNTCIGGKNYKIYCGTIGSVLFMLTLLLAGARDAFLPLRFASMGVLLLIPPNLCFWLLDLTLVAIHGYLIFNGITTWDVVTWMRAQKRSDVGTLFGLLYMFFGVDLPEEAVEEGDADMPFVEQYPDLPDTTTKVLSRQSSKEAPAREWSDLPVVRSRRGSDASSKDGHMGRERRPSNLSEEVIREVGGFLVGHGNAADLSPEALTIRETEIQEAEQYQKDQGVRRHRSAMLEELDGASTPQNGHAAIREKCTDTVHVGDETWTGLLKDVAKTSGFELQAGQDAPMQNDGGYTAMIPGTAVLVDDAELTPVSPDLRMQDNKPVGSSGHEVTGSTASHGPDLPSQDKSLDTVKDSELAQSPTSPRGPVSPRSKRLLALAQVCHNACHC